MAKSDTDWLLEQAGDGDEAAREALLQRHRSRLARMLAVRLDRQLATRLDTSDVVQETLAEAHAQLDEYLGSRPMSFYPWLRSLAERKLADAYRFHHRQRRDIDREQPLFLADGSVVELARQLVCPGTGPQRAQVRAETREQVRAALIRLPERDREVLVMYHLEQLTAGEIAEVLGLTEEAVRSRQRRALRRITRLLNPLR